MRGGGGGMGGRWRPRRSIHYIVEANMSDGLWFRFWVLEGLKASVGSAVIV